MDVKPKISDGSGSFLYRSTIPAGSVDKVIFELRTLDKNSNVIANSFPIKVNVYDLAGAKKSDEISINTDEFVFPSEILKQAGTYTFVFEDASGYETRQDIEIVP